MDASPLQRIDFNRLSSNLGHNQELIASLLELFLTSADRNIENLQRAEREHNVLLWMHQAHDLKGACLNITARRLSSLCIEAEEVNRLPHYHSTAVIYHMQKELALLREAINGYLANPPTPQ